MRLVMKGTPRAEALQYIACALGAELMAMEADQGPFNLTRYGEFLDSLQESLKPLITLGMTRTPPGIGTLINRDPKLSPLARQELRQSGVFRDYRCFCATHNLFMATDAKRSI
jgi:hypothetical protein